MNFTGEGPLCGDVLRGCRFNIDDVTLHADTTHRGEVHSMEERPGTPLTQIKGYLPVLESFGFVALLRKNTGGQAFPQLKFSHWGLMGGNPMDEEDTKETNAYSQVMSSRKRKGLKMALPKFGDYYDRI